MPAFLFSKINHVWFRFPFPTPRAPNQSAKSCASHTWACCQRAQWIDSADAGKPGGLKQLNGPGCKQKFVINMLFCRQCHIENRTGLSVYVCIYLHSQAYWVICQFNANICICFILCMQYIIYIYIFNWYCAQDQCLQRMYNLRTGCHWPHWRAYCSAIKSYVDSWILWPVLWSSRIFRMLAHKQQFWGS